MNPLPLLLACGAALGWTQAPAAAPASAVVAEHDRIEWKVSGVLPAGAATAEYHLVSQDPTTHGFQVLVRFSKGYSLAAHKHAYDETIVVTRGKLMVQFGGEKKTLGPGSYAFLPAGVEHALGTAGWGGCEAAISFSGPVDISRLAPL